MKEKLTWELIKNFFKTKLGIFTAVSVTAVAVGTGAIVVVNLKDEDFRSISIFELNGTSSLQREAETFEVYKGMLLQTGDQLSVKDDGYLRLLLDQDKYITLEPNSAINLYASGTSVDSNTKIELTKGAITNEIQNKLTSNSSYEVSTPVSTMAVRGTTYYVSLNQDESGHYQVSLYVFGGSVGTTLIMPDGTAAPKEVLINSGLQAEITNDDSSTKFVFNDHPINYEDLPATVIQHLVELKENNSLPDLPITVEELRKVLAEKEVAEQNSKLPEKEAPKKEVSSEKPTEVATEEVVAKPAPKKPAPKVPIEEATAEVPLTEEATTEVVAAAPAPAPTPAPSDTPSPSPSPEPAPPSQYTITFINGSPGTSTVFATQTLGANQRISRPILSPDADDYWYDSSGNPYMFESNATQNMTLYSQP